MKIEGVPEGYELVRIGPLYSGQPCQYIDWEGNIETHDGKDYMCEWAPIVKKIEKPKRYRPFASAEEFRPFRERWWRHVTDLEGTAHPPRAHCNDGWLTDSWVRLFERIEFDDGSPFGVEVTE